MTSTIDDHILVRLLTRLDRVPRRPTADDLLPIAVWLLYAARDLPVSVTDRTITIDDPQYRSRVMDSLPEGAAAEVADLFGSGSTVGSAWEGAEPVAGNNTLDSFDAAVVDATRAWLTERLDDYVDPDFDAAEEAAHAASIACVLPFATMGRPLTPRSINALETSTWAVSSVRFLRPTSTWEGVWLWLRLVSEQS